MNVEKDRKEIALDEGGDDTAEFWGGYGKLKASFPCWVTCKNLYGGKSLSQYRNSAWVRFGVVWVRYRTVYSPLYFMPEDHLFRLAPGW
jgi:hypothetical protein